MFVVDLTCSAAGHVFEGWFESAADVDAQLQDGSLTCPMCGDEHVKRRPSFAAIGKRSSASSEAPAQKMPLEAQRFFSRLLKAVRAHGEDVGPAFARTALAIHRGEQEERLVYGESTPDEERALVEEGVPFAKVPIPEIDEN